MRVVTGQLNATRRELDAVGHSEADGKWHKQGSGGRGGGRCSGRRWRLARWEEVDGTRLCAGLVEKAKKLPGDCFYEKPESRSSLRSVGTKKKHNRSNVFSCLEAFFYGKLLNNKQF